MFLTIEQFKQEWQAESDNTRKIFSALTDDSLKQAIADDHRTHRRVGLDRADAATGQLQRLRHELLVFGGHAGIIGNRAGPRGES